MSSTAKNDHVVKTSMCCSTQPNRIKRNTEDEAKQIINAIIDHATAFTDKANDDSHIWATPRRRSNRLNSIHGCDLPVNVARVQRRKSICFAADVGVAKSNCQDSKIKSDDMCKSIGKIVNETQTNGVDEERKPSAIVAEKTYLRCSIPLKKLCGVDLARYVHINDKPLLRVRKKFLCLYCDFEFNNATLHVRHVERFHAKKRSSPRKSTFTCMYCGTNESAFPNLSELFAHLLAQHSIKYHACSICKIRFANKNELQTHDKLVHTQSTNEDVIDTADTKLARLKCLPRGKRRSRDESGESMRNEKNEEEITNVVEKVDEKPDETLVHLSPVTSSTSMVPNIAYEFDDNFFKCVSLNIRNNLLNHLDGKLYLDREILVDVATSHYAKVGHVTEKAFTNLTLSATTPISSMLTSQNGIDSYRQIEYGSKAPSNAQTERKHYVKYNFRKRKTQFDIDFTNVASDVSKLDIMTQLSLKMRSDASLRKTASYFDNIHRIIETRAPYQDLHAETLQSSQLDTEHIVKMVLNNLIENVMTMYEKKTEKPDLPFKDPQKMSNHYPNYISNLNLSAACNPLSNRVTTRSRLRSVDVVSKRDTNDLLSYLNVRPYAQAEDPNKSKTLLSYGIGVHNQNLTVPEEHRLTSTLSELSGEWARPRMFICAACGLKLPNVKLLEDHKNYIHPNLWSLHYEFVGGQYKYYPHLSIPGIGLMSELDRKGNVKMTYGASEAKLCTKCMKRFNGAGELHKHLLECGNDWMWMNSKKKARSYYLGRVKKRRLKGFRRHFIRNTLNPMNPTQVRQSRRREVSKKQNRPRTRPSDAESIQRMLANLPPKRSTRKLICLKDGFSKKSTNPDNKSTASENVKVNGVKTQKIQSRTNANQMKIEIQRNLRNKNAEERKRQEKSKKEEIVQLNSKTSRKNGEHILKKSQKKEDDKVKKSPITSNKEPKRKITKSKNRILVKKLRSNQKNEAIASEIDDESNEDDQPIILFRKLAKQSEETSDEIVTKSSKLNGKQKRAHIPIKNMPKPNDKPINKNIRRPIERKTKSNFRISNLKNTRKKSFLFKKLMMRRRKNRDEKIKPSKRLVTAGTQTTDEKRNETGEAIKTIPKRKLIKSSSFDCGGLNLTTKITRSSSVSFKTTTGLLFKGSKRKVNKKLSGKCNEAKSLDISNSISNESKCEKIQDVDKNPTASDVNVLEGSILNVPLNSNITANLQNTTISASSNQQNIDLNQINSSQNDSGKSNANENVPNNEPTNPNNSNNNSDKPNASNHSNSDDWNKRNTDKNTDKKESDECKTNKNKRKSRKPVKKLSDCIEMLTNKQLLQQQDHEVLIDDDPYPRFEQPNPNIVQNLKEIHTTITPANPVKTNIPRTPDPSPTKPLIPNTLLNLNSALNLAHMHSNPGMYSQVPAPLWSSFALPAVDPRALNTFSVINSMMNSSMVNLNNLNVGKMDRNNTKKSHIVGNVNNMNVPTNLPHLDHNARPYNFSISNLLNNELSSNPKPATKTTTPEKKPISDPTSPNRTTLNSLLAYRPKMKPLKSPSMDKSLTRFKESESNKERVVGKVNDTLIILKDTALSPSKECVSNFNQTILPTISTASRNSLESSLLAVDLSKRFDTLQQNLQLEFASHRLDACREQTRLSLDDNLAVDLSKKSNISSIATIPTPPTKPVNSQFKSKTTTIVTENGLKHVMDSINRVASDCMSLMPNKMNNPIMPRRRLSVDVPSYRYLNALNSNNFRLSDAMNDLIEKTLQRKTNGVDKPEKVSGDDGQKLTTHVVGKAPIQAVKEIPKLGVSETLDIPYMNSIETPGQTVTTKKVDVAPATSLITPPSTNHPKETPTANIEVEKEPVDREKDENQVEISKLNKKKKRRGRKTWSRKRKSLPKLIQKVEKPIDPKTLDCCVPIVDELIDNAVIISQTTSTCKDVELDIEMEIPASVIKPKAGVEDLNLMLDEEVRTPLVFKNELGKKLSVVGRKSKNGRNHRKESVDPEKTDESRKAQQEVEKILDQTKQREEEKEKECGRETNQETDIGKQNVQFNENQDKEQNKMVLEPVIILEPNKKPKTKQNALKKRNEVIIVEEEKEKYGKNEDGEVVDKREEQLNKSDNLESSVVELEAITSEPMISENPKSRGRPKKKSKEKVNKRNLPGIEIHKPGGDVEDQFAKVELRNELQPELKNISKPQEMNTQETSKSVKVNDEMDNFEGEPIDTTLKTDNEINTTLSLNFVETEKTAEISTISDSNIAPDLPMVAKCTSKKLTRRTKQKRKRKTWCKKRNSSVVQKNKLETIAKTKVSTENNETAEESGIENVPKIIPIEGSEDQNDITNESQSITSDLNLNKVSVKVCEPLSAIQVTLNDRKLSVSETVKTFKKHVNAKIPTTFETNDDSEAIPLLSITESNMDPEKNAEKRTLLQRNPKRRRRWSKMYRTNSRTKKKSKNVVNATQQHINIIINDVKPAKVERKVEENNQLKENVKGPEPLKDSEPIIRVTKVVKSPRKRRNSTINDLENINHQPTSPNHDHKKIDEFPVSILSNDKPECTVEIDPTKPTNKTNVKKCQPLSLQNAKTSAADVYEFSDNDEFTDDVLDGRFSRNKIRDSVKKQQDDSKENAIILKQVDANDDSDEDVPLSALFSKKIDENPSGNPVEPERNVEIKSKVETLEITEKTARTENYSLSSICKELFTNLPRIDSTRALPSGYNRIFGDLDRVDDIVTLNKDPSNNSEANSSMPPLKMTITSKTVNRKSRGKRKRKVFQVRDCSRKEIARENEKDLVDVSGIEEIEEIANLENGALEAIENVEAVNDDDDDDDEDVPLASIVKKNKVDGNVDSKLTNQSANYEIVKKINDTTSILDDVETEPPATDNKILPNISLAPTETQESVNKENEVIETKPPPKQLPKNLLLKKRRRRKLFSNSKIKRKKFSNNITNEMTTTFVILKKPGRKTDKSDLLLKIEKRATRIKKNQEFYCDICKKYFCREKNYDNHKRTFTHIAKLSEIEAKEMELRRKIEGEKENDVKVDNGNEKEKELEERFSPVDEHESLEPFSLLNNEINYPDLIISNQPKRYRSLAERKSFDATLETEPIASDRNFADIGKLAESPVIFSPPKFNPKKPPVSRKKLNTDEALFVECCSLLRSSSENRKAHDESYSSWNNNKNFPVNCHAELNESIVNPTNPVVEPESSKRVFKQFAFTNVLEDAPLERFDVEEINEFVKPVRTADDFNAHSSDSNMSLDLLDNPNDSNLSFNDLNYTSSNSSYSKRQSEGNRESASCSTSYTGKGSIMRTKGALKGFDGIKVSIPLAKIRDLDAVLRRTNGTDDLPYASDKNLHLTNGDGRFSYGFESIADVGVSTAAAATTPFHNTFSLSYNKNEYAKRQQSPDRYIDGVNYPFNISHHHTSENIDRDYSINNMSRFSILKASSSYIESNKERTEARATTAVFSMQKSPINKMCCTNIPFEKFGQNEKCRDCCDGCTKTCGDRTIPENDCDKNFCYDRSRRKCQFTCKDANCLDKIKNFSTFKCSYDYCCNDRCCDEPKRSSENVQIVSKNGNNNVNNDNDRVIPSLMDDEIHNKVNESNEPNTRYFTDEKFKSKNGSDDNVSKLKSTYEDISRDSFRSDMYKIARRNSEIASFTSSSNSRPPPSLSSSGNLKLYKSGQDVTLSVLQTKKFSLNRQSTSLNVYDFVSDDSKSAKSTRSVKSDKSRDKNATKTFDFEKDDDVCLNPNLVYETNQLFKSIRNRLSATQYTDMDNIIYQRHSDSDSQQSDDSDRHEYVESLSYDEYSNCKFSPNPDRERNITSADNMDKPLTPRSSEKNSIKTNRKKPIGEKRPVKRKTKNVSKKSSKNENYKKCMIMGRIFKHTVNRPNETLETVSESNISNPSQLSNINSDAESQSATKKSRKRVTYSSSDEEFNLKPARKFSKVRKKRKAPVKDVARDDTAKNSINIEQEIRECIGVASRKSQRKCTSGKQNLFVEFWSSDEMTDVDRRKPRSGAASKNVNKDANDKSKSDKLSETNDKSKRKNARKPKAKNDKPGDNPEFELPLNPNLDDNVNKKHEISNDVNYENTEENFTLNSGDSSSKLDDVTSNVKVVKNNVDSVNSDTVNSNDDVNRLIKSCRADQLDPRAINAVHAGDTVAMRRKRRSGEKLYYWSSSSSDEEKVPDDAVPDDDGGDVDNGNEADDDDDRPMQHGWIVGDSPKKLVTMLAQAKGKAKIENECLMMAKKPKRKNK